MSMTTEELKSGLKIAKARLTEFKKTHKELRKDYLEEKLVEAVATGKTKKASDLKKKIAPGRKHQNVVLHQQIPA